MKNIFLSGGSRLKTDVVMTTHFKLPVGFRKMERRKYFYQLSKQRNTAAVEFNLFVLLPRWKNHFFSNASLLSFFSKLEKHFLLNLSRCVVASVAYSTVVAVAVATFVVFATVMAVAVAVVAIMLLW